MDRHSHFTVTADLRPDRECRVVAPRRGAAGPGARKTPATSLSRPAWAQAELGPAPPSGRAVEELAEEATEAALDEIIWILRNSKWDSLRARVATTWLAKAPAISATVDADRADRRAAFEALMAEMRQVPQPPVTDEDDVEIPMPVEPPPDVEIDDPAWQAETVSTMDPWA